MDSVLKKLNKYFRIMIMVPIVYILNGRSPSRLKQSFSNLQIKKKSNKSSIFWYFAKNVTSLTIFK